MIRLAYLIDTISCDTSGTEKQLLETIKRIDHSIFEVHLVMLKTSGWIENNRIPCQYYISGYKGFIKTNIILVIKDIGKYLRKNKIDIVHTFFEESIFMALLAKIISRRKIALVSSRRDIGLGKENRPWYYFLYYAILPIVNRMYATIIANSEEIKKYVSKKERTKLTKITVIRNGINIENKSNKKAVSFKKHPKKILIVKVASLNPVKRHKDLLDAVIILKKRGIKNFKVIILGDGPLRDRLQFIAQKNNITNYVIFKGAVRNVYDYLNHADIGVLCSEREGLSNAIMEYMACALPVVATKTGGNQELVNEENGFIIPVKSPRALADALEKLIINNSLRKKLGEKSFQIIENNYSWVKTINQLTINYMKLINRKC